MRAGWWDVTVCNQKSSTAWQQWELESEEPVNGVLTRSKLGGKTNKQTNKSFKNVSSHGKAFALL